VAINPKLKRIWSLPNSMALLEKFGCQLWQTKMATEFFQ
jgi:hypothetical protein